LRCKQPRAPGQAITALAEAAGAVLGEQAIIGIYLPRRLGVATRLRARCKLSGLCRVFIHQPKTQRFRGWTAQVLGLPNSQAPVTALAALLCAYANPGFRLAPILPGGSRWAFSAPDIGIATCKSAREFSRYLSNMRYLNFLKRLSRAQT